MPLDNARRERFAQEIAKGSTATKAYELAGYRPNDANASKLANHPEVKARIQEITGKAAVRAEITVASLIQDLRDVLAMAMKSEQASAAVSAIKEIGILSGKRVERHEQGQPGEFEMLDDDELMARIIEMNRLANIQTADTEH